jgi:hypothetical protein
MLGIIQQYICCRIMINTLSLAVIARPVRPASVAVVDVTVAGVPHVAIEAVSRSLPVEVARSVCNISLTVDRKNDC